MSRGLGDVYKRQVLLLAADLLGQRLAYVANLPIGLMTGLLGGFYLLWLLLRSRRI
ncbi:iron chelate uptake ABC transporter family permease subunit [Pseudomonas aeruginosa]|uniref:iron chelate uptake ABC transporter family permease subunit n=1 Tax=Pseudomonas aeruginosa TaxID=287 RepID=UPI0035B63FE9